MKRFKQGRVICTIFLLLMIYSTLVLTVTNSYEPLVIDDLATNDGKLVYGWSTAQVVSSNSDLRYKLVAKERP